METSIYRDIAERTGGDIYIGVVGHHFHGLNGYSKNVGTLIQQSLESFRHTVAKQVVPVFGAEDDVISYAVCRV